MLSSRSTLRPYLPTRETKPSGRPKRCLPILFLETFCALVERRRLLMKLCCNSTASSLSERVSGSISLEEAGSSSVEAEVLSTGRRVVSAASRSPMLAFDISLRSLLTSGELARDFQRLRGRRYRDCADASVGIVCRRLG